MVMQNIIASKTAKLFSAFRLERISSQLMLAMCAISLLLALSVGTYNYLRISEITVNMALESQGSKVRLLAARFKSVFDQMQNDAFVLSRTPPIKGIMRSTMNNDVDPADGSSTHIWRKRLETIFSSILMAREHYTQIRYVGLADNGRELVRVDRTIQGVKSVLAADLQQKAEEPYFKMAQGAKPGDFYFSEVTLNKEHGNIDAKRTPTIRAVLPVFDGKGKQFGMVIVNANYEGLIRGKFSELTLSKNAYVINHSGDYVAYTPGKGASRLEMHGYIARPVPAYISSFMASPAIEQTIVNNDIVAQSVKVEIGSGGSHEFIGAMIVAPKDKLLTDVYATRRTTIWLSILLVGLALLATILITRKVTKPLKQVTDIIAHAKSLDSTAELPLTANNEVGDLARALRELSLRIIESEAKAQGILDKSVDGIITINERGVIVEYNPGCERIFGYKADEIIGEKVNKLMPDGHRQNHDDYMKRYHETDEARKVGMERELEGLRKNGEVVPIEISISEVRLGEKRLYSGIIRDITERRKAENERQKLIDALSRSNSELDNFAHIAAHDLKEPLRAIHNHCSFLVEDYADNLDEAGKKRIDRLQTLTQKMERLISDLMNYSRLGREKIAIQNTDLNEVIFEIEDMLKDAVSDASLVIDVPNSLPTTVCDYVRVKELFRNLITNAVKYNDSPEKRVEIGFENQGEGVFYVKDNGIGIAEEFHQDVFRIFKRLHNEKLYGEGTGSGLTFVKKIVEQHNGRIWVDSKEGEGTTFYFTLNERKAA